MDKSPSTSKSRRLGSYCALFLLMCLSGYEASAQVTIHHEPIECLARNRHTVVKASVVLAKEEEHRYFRALTANAQEDVRLYFRAGDGTLYFVDMVREGDDFQAVLPRPHAQTQRVSYYIRVSDPVIGDAQTPVREVQVLASEDQCRGRDPSVVYFSGDEPHIILRSSEKGASPDPPGFALDGVTGFEPAPTESGGDDRTILWLGIGSAAAGTASVGLLSGSSQSDPVVTPPPSPPPPPTPPPTTPPPVGPTPPTTLPTIACFDAAPKVTAGQQVRLDASCSSPRDSLQYEWALGDERRRTGRVINPTYRVPGTYTVELTVRQPSGSSLDTDRMTRQIEVVSSSSPGPPPSNGNGGADLAIEIIGILTPRIFAPWGITYIMTITNFGPEAATGITVTDTFPPPMSLNRVSGAFCAMVGPTLTCDLTSLSAFSSKTLTVDVRVSGAVSVGDTVYNDATVTAATGDPNPGNNTARSAVQIAIAQRAPEGSGALRTSFTSSLEGWPTPLQGQVLSNRNQVDPVQSSTPFQHQVEAVVGMNRLEAYLASSSDAEGLWRFDFSRTAHFVSGSFEVRQGRVLSRSSHALVFQLHGHAGEKIEFTYRLAQ